MKKLLFLSCCFSFLLAQCGSDDTVRQKESVAESAAPSSKANSDTASFTSAPSASQSPDTPMIVFVLFDYSESLEDNIKATATRAYNLVTSCPPGVTLKFLPINNQVRGDAIETIIRTPEPFLPMEAAAWKEKIGEEAERIFLKIKTMHEIKPVKSCIVNGFKTVLNHAKGLRSMNRVKVMVLSDMLECCDGFPCGDKAGGFSQLLNAIDNYSLGACPLESYVKLEDFIVVVSSSENPTYQAISNSAEFDQFWNLVAKGMGYDTVWHFNPNMDEAMKLVFSK